MLWLNLDVVFVFVPLTHLTAHNFLITKSQLMLKLSKFISGVNPFVMVLGCLAQSFVFFGFHCVSYLAPGFDSWFMF